MTTTFPRTPKKTLGYNTAQVESFLAAARKAYDATDDGGEGAPLTAETIRHTAFSLHKGGYSPAHVDAALERLEDAFATRDRDRATRAQGKEAWLEEAHDLAQVLVNRLGRADHHRFSRVSILTVGYSRVDVDRFASRLVRYFEDGFPVTIEDVRCAVFRPQRGGYREAQVDVVLDGVIDVMLAVR
ncbi:DivIVA domain-containing protein [Cryobacterium sp. TmT2-59]|uniref:DivIVA domain-containing protein n=1 Tax=Cryobacterium shii TaxID=1259235 RepID=A0AAQ2C959_9MICO|nr:MULTISPECIES: DivIVA domain-containing protein [Cryobacterium]TFC52379.1 DivIVA domain-containing protein [Cryobacterium shii]TFC87491.1 DivIVA domain-containing protein [Cryobacterium sp. TmT2-59]TFD16539.1 DivIVA domain-containing protein [Cryobacterium sp. TMT2-23]TFD20508.1 DivIVA domain-containing protein [Cryobacterium sp. TMT4-10]